MVGDENRLLGSAVIPDILRVLVVLLQVCEDQAKQTFRLLILMLALYSVN